MKFLLHGHVDRINVWYENISYIIYIIIIFRKKTLVEKLFFGKIFSAPYNIKKLPEEKLHKKNYFLTHIFLRNII